MFRLRAVFAALVLASGPILATIPAVAQDAGDPPTDVARIAAISGSVSTHQPGSQDWQQAQQNYPLAPGSGVWAEPRSHAAVDVAGARVHLDGSSQLEITAINQGQVQLAVAQGAAYVHVYPGSQGVNLQINTAHGTANISQPGQYEIVAGDDQNPSSLSVIEGQAQFVGQNANLGLQAGQRGNIDPNNGSSTDAAQPDDFVRMVQQEEQPYQQQVAQTAQYVSPQQTGYQDLARYGQWSQAPQYGAVWYPQAVPANWAPYRYGHWAYVAPWGWTWVDDQPWGFTPFHYGRWVQVGHRWGWIPGVRVERPVYAPALVAFFDLGGGASIDLSLGWVPLGPQEVYVPYYRHSPRYVREVNITNVRNETTIINVVNKKTVINYNNYVNYRGATSVSRDVVQHGRPVGQEWSKRGNGKFDQQWAKAKPEQEVAFRPQEDASAPRGSGPKVQPQWQSRQNVQPNGRPSSKPITAAEPQAPQPGKNWNNNAGKPKIVNQPQFMAQPKNNSGKPRSNGPVPYIPPANNAAQQLDAPSGKTRAPVAATNIPAPPRSNKAVNVPQWGSNGQTGKNQGKKNQQPPLIYPTNAAKPDAQQHYQEPTSKKAQWKAQQGNPQLGKSQGQPQFVPRQTQQQSKHQPQQSQAVQRVDKAPKPAPSGAQQQKKPAANCGQQPGACQN